MNTTTTETILKILAVLATVVAVVLAIVYTNMLKTLKGTSGQGTAPITASSPSAQIVKSPALVEANMGTIVDLTVQSDETVKLTINTQGPAAQKTYQLPSDLKVKLYTSATETTLVPLNQIKKGTIVNVIKFTKPDHFEVFGVTDKALVGKLL